jgi:GNAT superfamily N-acetyltransferase
MTTNVVRGYLPGAIGWIAALHGTYYHRQAGFGAFFEAKVARELADFTDRFDVNRDGLWLLTDGGRMEGSIAIDGLHAAAEGAHLRWFIVSDERRGQGFGSALLTAGLDFCRQRRYERVTLWTFAGLDAARHLYEKYGFRMTEERPGRQWGTEVQEQRFEWRRPPA